MFKKVIIETKRPIRTVKPVILKSVNGITLSVGDIRRVLYCRAIVKEILKDGTLVNLNLNNYDKDNSNLMTSKPVEKISPKAVEPQEKVEEPKAVEPQEKVEEPKAVEPQEKVEEPKAVDNKQQNNNQKRNNNKK